MPIVYIIVPLFNEEQSINSFLYSLELEISKIKNVKFKIIYVNDGSDDNSVKIILERATLPSLIVSMYKNYGKEAAIIAGLAEVDYSSNCCAIVMDADLQHPPDLIELMINEWIGGAKLVEAVKTIKNKNINSCLTGIFYSVIRFISGNSISYRGSDYRLLDKIFIAWYARTRYLKPTFRFDLDLIAGQKKTIINFEVPKRLFGASKFSYISLIKMALTVFTKHTRVIFLTNLILSILSVIILISYPQIYFVIFLIIVFMILSAVYLITHIFDGVNYSDAYLVLERININDY